MKWLFAVLALMASVAGCSTVTSTGRPMERPFEIVQTKFLGSLWNESHAKASIVSQDGGASFIVPDGTVWAFGDTFKGSRSADGTPHFAGGAISTAIAWLPDQGNIYPPAFNFLVSSNGDAVSPFEFLPKEQPTQRIGSGHWAAST